MQLGDILDDYTLDVATGGLEITHVDIDSRECVPGIPVLRHARCVDERNALRRSTPSSVARSAWSRVNRSAWPLRSSSCRARN